MPQPAPAAKHRRGVVPNDLVQRIVRATEDFGLRATARGLGATLDGLPPSALTAEELTELRERWGAEDADGALQVLTDVGYGARPEPRARAQRAHGVRREARLKGVLGKLPRSLALRLPTTADTHRSGRNDGKDAWGQVMCSRTLRSEHLGLLAAAGGLWHARAGDGEGHVDCSAGELVHLLRDERRVSGKSIACIHERLGDLETLELHADVDANRKGDASEAHVIPGPPIERVERRLGDRWVSLRDYEEASRAAGDEDLQELSAAERAACSGLPTIRIHLAAWLRAELAHSKRRPVFVNFDVWRHLRPSSQRLYAYVQGSGRDGYDDHIYFYLAPPLQYTLGISTERLDRAANDVTHDITAIRHADKRYHQGFGRHTHATTKWPAWRCNAARVPSAPTEKALASRSAPKRPSDLRGAWARLRRHSLRSSCDVSDDQLDPEHVRRVGVEAARREAEQVRTAIRRSLGEAPAASREPGPFEPDHLTSGGRQDASRAGPEP